MGAVNAVLFEMRSDKARATIVRLVSVEAGSFSPLLLGGFVRTEGSGRAGRGRCGVGLWFQDGAAAEEERALFALTCGRRRCADVTDGYYVRLWSRLGCARMRLRL